ncbi:MAG: hypothetical protein Q8K75_00660 [Chlamydiales bacterium]|nr:hypothetical protein [Chlamydiales bacterium]
MMNPFVKFTTFFLSLLVASSIAATQGFSSEPVEEGAWYYLPEPLVEVKAGYFNFSDSKLRKIYDKGGLDMQLCASYPLRYMNQWVLNAYGAVEFFQRSGTSLNGDQKTSLWSIPINLGIKPVYTISPNMQYYFAIGPRYFYIHQHNSSPYVYRNRSGNGLGFFANTGFHRMLDDGLMIDVFAEYSYGKVRFQGGRPAVYTTSMQIGGVTLGAGLGYEF